MEWERSPAIDCSASVIGFCFSLTAPNTARIINQSINNEPSLLSLLRSLSKFLCLQSRSSELTSLGCSADTGHDGREQKVCGRGCDGGYAAAAAAMRRPVLHSQMSADQAAHTVNAAAATAIRYTAASHSNSLTLTAVLSQRLCHSRRSAALHSALHTIHSMSPAEAHTAAAAAAIHYCTLRHRRCRASPPCGSLT